MPPPVFRDDPVGRLLLRGGREGQRRRQQRELLPGGARARRRRQRQRRAQPAPPARRAVHPDARDGPAAAGLRRPAHRGAAGHAADPVRCCRCACRAATRTGGLRRTARDVGTLSPRSRRCWTPTRRPSTTTTTWRRSSRAGAATAAPRATSARIVTTASSCVCRVCINNCACVCVARVCTTVCSCVCARVCVCVCVSWPRARSTPTCTSPSRDLTKPWTPSEALARLVPRRGQGRARDAPAHARAPDGARQVDVHAILAHGYVRIRSTSRSSISTCFRENAAKDMYTGSLGCSEGALPRQLCARGHRHRATPTTGRRLAVHRRPRAGGEERARPDGRGLRGLDRLHEVNAGLPTPRSLGAVALRCAPPLKNAARGRRPVDPYRASRRRPRARTTSRGRRVRYYGRINDDHASRTAARAGSWRSGTTGRRGGARRARHGDHRGDSLQSS